PNQITGADFDGWVQERGLYFMTDWDSNYVPLLSGHDPGEEEKPGGMLITRFGEGYYIYSAYAWFRQMPAGVPGAFRIFANMLSLGGTVSKAP
ncbi:MAG: LmbE family protein, partial [Acidobacteriota bacterium]